MLHQFDKARQDRSTYRSECESGLLNQPPKARVRTLAAPADTMSFAPHWQISGPERWLAIPGNADKVTPEMDSELIQYLPVLMLLLVAVGFAGGTLVVSVVAGKVGRRTRTKDIPYECGMLPQGDGSSRLSVKFYLVALLFVLFDIEVVFMYPWAIVYRDLLRENAALILGGMVSFMGTLFAGYLYALKKGAFDWTK